ncbi:Probable serine/threonine-protein kinase At1g01540, partial [Linum perenne]
MSTNPNCIFPIQNFKTFKKKLTKPPKISNPNSPISPSQIHNHSIMQYSALFKPTPFFGIKLWILILFIASLIACLVIASAVLCIIDLHRHRRIPKSNQQPCLGRFAASSSLDRRLLSSQRISEYSWSCGRQDGKIVGSDDLESGSRMRVDVGKGSDLELRSVEIEAATGGFADCNRIGIGEHGGVGYCGVLFGNTRVAVVKLPTESCEAKKLKMEMELIGHIKHKNLVQLLGYCVEADHRVIVTEYVDNNGSLHQWLHQESSPLSWDLRMNILQGVAKGLAYLHEHVDPKIVHGHLKSSVILLDRQWNAKISDVGISKLVECPRFAATHSMESDVYSFGVLVMETVCGRSSSYKPVNGNSEGSLIEWLKSMVVEEKATLVVDPKLLEMPSSKELKRVLLVGLMCVDPEVSHRPKMGEVVHMLETSDIRKS